MKTIDTPVATATILSERIVLVRAKAGVQLDGNDALEGHRLIAEAMPGPYGQIIDRVEDYSMVPLEVFEVLNRNTRLQALAIVVHRSSSLVNAEIDKRLFERAIEVFTSVDQARDWLEQILPR